MRSTGRMILCVAAGAFALAAFGAAAARAQTYRSALAVVVSPDGKTLYATDKTTGCVAVIDAAAGKKTAEIAIDGEPSGLALSADGKTLYVAQRLAGSVAVIDAAKNAVSGKIAVGPWPVAVLIAEKGKRLYVCNRGDHTVSVVDLAAGKQIKQVPVVRDPFCAAVTPDESRLIVTNYMPYGPGADPTLAAEVSILDAAALEQVAKIKLPPGSTAVNGVCCSPDGKWAYVIHALGRFNLPVTQLERGWSTPTR